MATSLAIPFIQDSSMSKSKLHDLPLVAPAILMFFVLWITPSQCFGQSKAEENQIRQDAYIAIQEGDFELARTYLDLLAEKGELSDRDRLVLVHLLTETGDMQQAEEILNELAPDDKPGFGPAHDRKAITIANQLRRKKNMKQHSKSRQLLRHHLDHASNTNEPAMAQAWAIYHVANEDYDSAAESYLEAAKSDPYFYVVLSDLYTKQEQTKAAGDALNKAREAFEAIVAKNEKQDVDSGKERNVLASILLKLQQYDDAEKLLKDASVKNINDPDRRQMAQLGLLDFYLKRYDKSVELDENFKQQFRYLKEALALTENQKFDPVYTRIANLYQRNRSVEEAQECKQVLLDAASSDSPSVTAMFSLSNIYWVEGDTENATLYLEYAYKLDPDFLDVANNLAWMLAHSENPDVDRAVELAKTAVEKSPQNPMYRDTYASILFLQENYEQAIVEFQKALPEIPANSKKAIHEKLAICYRETGNMELSKRHQQRADEKSTTETE